MDMKLEVVVLPARTGEADPNWPDWYAEYMVREQSGEELPT